MDFATLPPEVNSGRMYTGPGSGPLLAAAAVWDGLASDLHSAASSYGSVISGLVAGPWLGPSSVSMAAAASPYVAWMSTTAAQAEQAATQAKVAAAAYEVAFAATVPPPVVMANRVQLRALVVTNLFGQNTPAIATTETHYAEMWAQDAAAMYGYAGVSASATTLTPFTQPPQTSNPGGLGDQAAGLAQATGTSAATNTQQVLSKLTSTLPTALQGLATPSASPALAALPTSGLLALLQDLGLISPSTILEPSALGLGSAELTTASGAWADAAQGDDEMQAAQVEIAEEQRALTDRIRDVGGQIMDRFNQLGPVGLAGSAGTAGLGEAATVGALSVPPGWVAAAPEMRLAAVGLPATSLAAAPEVFAASPGSLFSEMALASMAGRAMGGTVTPGRRERIGATTRARLMPSPGSPGSHMTGIAAEIRDLAVLREAGILTDDEFDEQKQCLLRRNLDSARDQQIGSGAV